MTVQDTEAYTGVDNLEVMADAVKYNNFLIDCVAKRTSPTERVADFGAGAGTFAEMLRDRGFSVLCIEPDDRLAAILDQKGLAQTQDSKTIPDDDLDCVYTFNVLEHIEDDVAAAREIHRILKPGGRLVVYVPAFQILFGEMDRKVRHFRRYTKSGMRDVLVRAGFQIDSAEYVDSAGFFATLLYNLLDMGKGDLNPAAVRFYDRYLFPISRAMDLILSPFFGKNVLVYAVKP
ncbi:MAG: class I SAM-dependent methyltransferase [Alphaproteobacteria bacterium]|nr:class I SAM-dependent methyltransferase [Alphaproteobacteria bacterium]